MSGRREMRRGNAAASAGAATTAPLDARTIVVVGAGIGGLVVAGRLAMEGHSVTLLEQNEQVRGGGMHVRAAASSPTCTDDASAVACIKVLLAARQLAGTQPCSHSNPLQRHATRMPGGWALPVSAARPR